MRAVTINCEFSLPHLMHRFGALQSSLPEWLVKQACPVVHGYNHLAILCANQLSMINNCRRFHHSHIIIQAPDPCMPVCLFEQAKTAVQLEFHMSYDEDGFVQARQDPPCKILHDIHNYSDSCCGLNNDRCGDGGWLLRSCEWPGSGAAC